MPIILGLQWCPTMPIIYWKQSGSLAISGLDLVFVFGCGGFLVALGTGKLETQPRIPQAAGAWRFGLAGRSGGLWEVKKTSSPCKTACWQVKRKQKTTCQCKHFVPPWWGWFLIWWTQTIRRDPYQWNFRDFLGTLFCWWSLWKIYANSIPTYFQIILYKTL